MSDLRELQILAAVRAVVEAYELATRDLVELTRHFSRPCRCAKVDGICQETATFTRLVRQRFRAMQ